MRSVVVAFVLLIGVSANTSFACENWVAKVVSTNGLVEIKEGSQSKSAEIDSVVCPGQVISVAANSRAALYLLNNSFVRLDQNTVLAFPKAPSDQGFWVQLQQGVSHFISRITQRFVVDAPYVNAAVDGTEFLVSAQGKESSVSVIEGQVTASNEGGQQVLTMGQKAVATGKASGFRLTPIQTEDVIDWAIYYSPLPVLQELQASDSDPVYQELIEQTQQQRPDLALQALQKQTLTESLRVADAALLMSVGQAEKALAQIESSTSTQALALKSVIFSSRNQSEKALAYAQKAVQQDSQSSAALLALSYAHQAALNLPEALQAAHQATLLEENNAIAWARVSEMELAMGNIRQADKAIAHAQQKQPDSAYVITQAGFIKLFNIRIDSAKALFKQAIELDSENPQAHLGLGLALLRQGELKQGREQLEYATSLDPARSVVRSYLGRAYFEEKRDEEAGTQWALAKQLDPNDPTPYFYEGVRKLYANDPIGAIEELETSRKLNDERALYRSETLLQSDAASRSATLARAYDDVGYDQGVLLSGWDALKNDPTSSEGHRLLADYYRGNSRYETARASELLQSQLWQPLSAYPLQPQLSEGDISFVEGSGPQKPSYNEYHSMFTQDGIYASLNGFGGSDETWGNDLVAGFLAGPIALSVGQYHFESGGWRENTAQNQDIYNVFVQYDYSPSTSFQLESRSFDWEHGFLTPYYLDDLDNSGEFEEDRKTHRLGMRHYFSNEQALIVSLIRQNLDITQRVNAVNSDFEALPADEFNSAEVQYVFKTNDLKGILGAGRWRIQKRLDEFLGVYFGDDGLLPNSYDFSIDRRSDQLYDVYNVNGYLYFQIDERLEIVVGADFDKVEIEHDEFEVQNAVLFIPFPPPGAFFSSEEQFLVEENHQTDEFSPKIGFSYGLNPNSMVRGAIFKSYSRFLAANYTVEPAQFVGFNQLFKDRNFSESENVGLGFDHGFADGTSVSVNALVRDIDALEFDSIEGDFRKFELSEYYLDAGLYTQLGEAASVVVGANVTHRKYEDSTQGFENLLKDIRVASMPVRLLFQNEKGWLFALNNNYYINRFSFFSDQRDTRSKSQWVTDVSLEKRFFKESASIKFGVDNVLGAEDELSSYDLSSLMYYPNQFVYFNFNISI